MIKWFKKSQSVSSKTNEIINDPSLIINVEKEIEQLTTEQEIHQEETPKSSLYTRLRKSLSKTRHQFGEGVGRLLLGRKAIDATIFEELETLLLRADLGIETTHLLLKQLEQGLARKELADGDAVFETLKERLESLLTNNAKPLCLETSNNAPFVILTIGINGAGKTTTIGKLAKQYQQQGKKVMLAAGDTFRAAAVQQLQVWGERNQIPVIAQQSGADSASVIYDALQAATARRMDVLIVDTAGRLHTQSNLMEELKKVKRVIQKLNPDAPHETMLVLDASIGQNALNQAREFHQAIGLTGITMTKLDGTAKGGILFAIANELAIPFRYLGIGWLA